MKRQKTPAPEVGYGLGPGWVRSAMSRHTGGSITIPRGDEPERLMMGTPLEALRTSGGCV